MKPSTRQYLFRSSAAWLVLALTSCAPAYSSAPLPPERSVALLVNNQCAEPIAIHVLRQSATAQRLGYVGGRQSRLFDVTRVAPVGSTVRFAGDRHGVVAFVSDEIRIRRPSSILVEVEPERLSPNGAACDAPARWYPSRTTSSAALRGRTPWRKALHGLMFADVTCLKAEDEQSAQRRLESVRRPIFDSAPDRSRRNCDRFSRQRHRRRTWGRTQDAARRARAIHRV